MPADGSPPRATLTLAILLATLSPSRAQAQAQPEADAAAADEGPLPAPPPAPVVTPEVAPAAGDAASQSLGEEIVVSATRSPRPVHDVAATVTVVPRAELERSPAKSADELLMTVPSFDLFRRSSSLAADPSSQGVKLRGVGGTAVARTLVLLDGVPVNDPYAGWVAWRAFPSLGLERIEVVPGGGAALYGNYALGGVVQLISRPITPGTLAAQVEAGSFGTERLEAHASHRLGPVGLAVGGEYFESSGYEVVAQASRGPVDRATPGRHATVNARLEAEVTRDLLLTARAGYFFQDQVLGTTFTTASMRRLELSGGATWTAGEAGRLALTIYGHRGDFEQGRARVAAGRVSEVSNGRQDVPADDVGASLLWHQGALRLGGTHHLTIGADARWITGTTDERLDPPTVTAATVTRRVARGDQALTGAFVQDVYRIGEAVEATVAVRYDHFTNTGAERTSTRSDGASTTQAFADRSDDQVDPKVGLRLRALEWLTLRGSAYRAFRAPTLDELYRPFQVQTTYTLANEDLAAETLTGGEAGVEVAPVGSGLRVRATGFWNELENPVTNVTLPDTTPCPPGTATCRQRQNLGTARIQGVEASADVRLRQRWLAGASYAFIDATVTGAPANPALVGKRLAQNPRYRATLSLTYDDPQAFTAGAQVRALGQQYEDDANTLPLHEAGLVDVFATWHVSRTVDLFLAVNNLLDETYLVGRAGVDTIGQPRFVHGGLRFQPGRQRPEVDAAASHHPSAGDSLGPSPALP